MNKYFKITHLGKAGIICLIILSSSLFAGIQTDKIPPSEQKQVIDSVSSYLKENYLFPEKAEDMISKLNDKFTQGKYSSIRSYDQYGQAITRDLRSIKNDRHLWIWYNPEWIQNERSRLEGLTTGIDIGLVKAKKDNFGFKEIRILDGNVGYFRFDEFSTYPEALGTINGAFNFLQFSDALIIDLRNNTGGSPETVQLLCSYFFASPSVHLNSLKFKEESHVIQYWTYYFVSGPRITEQPVYVLVSEKTASAAEEFAYNLQKLNRAKIVGTLTRGAAHHNEFKIINNNYFMSIPIAQAINPITKDNWEGSGIEPDISAESNVALDKAYQSALLELLKISTDNHMNQKYKQLLKKLEAKSPINSERY
jgi:C-terminal processing protease CtpA/Prc